MISWLFRKPGSFLQGRRSPAPADRQNSCRHIDWDTVSQLDAEGVDQGHGFSVVQSAEGEK
jgi:hypothetical protein